MDTCFSPPVPSQIGDNVAYLNEIPVIPSLLLSVSPRNFAGRRLLIRIDERIQQLMFSTWIFSPR